MKIAVFVTQIAKPQGYERNVSAHGQLPFHTIALLQSVGHEVHLVTDNYGEGMAFPECLPSGTPVRVIATQSSMPDLTGDVPPPPIKIGPFGLWGLVRRFNRIVAEESYDVVHFFGTERVALFASLTVLSRRRIPAVLTINSFAYPRLPALCISAMRRRLSAIITSTEFISARLAAHGISAMVLRHGIVRDFAEELGAVSLRSPHRVLFWRDPSLDNGADICGRVFEMLAPRFPDIAFDFAVRPLWPLWPQADGLGDLASKIPNISLYKFPYSGDVSLPQLIAESKCIVLPFRRLTYHPQFSVLESLASGAPVVTTDLDSNRELVFAGGRGVLVPVNDIRATALAVESCLAEQTLHRSPGELFAQTWTWSGYCEALDELYHTAQGR